MDDIIREKIDKATMRTQLVLELVSNMECQMIENKLNPAEMKMVSWFLVDLIQMKTIHALFNTKLRKDKNG